MQLKFVNGVMDLEVPRVMGILNVTPDSFSDGGRYVSLVAATERSLEILEEGADILDVGGESTRPGAAAVSAAEEIDRVVPVIEAVRAETNAPISVDTSKPEVMRAAVAAGASMLNDVRALQEEGALEVAAELDIPACLMHMQGSPRTMQLQPEYADVVTDVREFLRLRTDACVAAGMNTTELVLDPGFGFGKTLEHNLALMQRLEVFVRMGQPVLVGVSRKSMIGKLLGDDTRDRLMGSVTLALAAARKGAHIIRVHDVRETVDALRIDAAVRSEG